MTICAATNVRIGANGEQLALSYVKNLGYKIHAKNVRISHDEIDIVCFDPMEKAIVFLEVKARSRDTGFSPWLNITQKKRQALFRAARAWVRKYDYEGGYRIDVICIVRGKVTEHIQEISA